MYVHVNTVRYRISRVEALTGRDLSALADRVDFFLALRAGYGPAPNPPAGYRPGPGRRTQRPPEPRAAAPADRQSAGSAFAAITDA